MLFHRFGAKPLIITGIALSCVAFWINSVTPNVYGFYVSSILLGTGVCFPGVSMPLETVCVPLITSEFFSKNSFEKVVGFFSAAGCAGAALGSPLINLCYDLSGSYIPIVLLWSAVITLLMFGYRRLFRKKQNISQEVLT